MGGVAQNYTDKATYTQVEPLDKTYMNDREGNVQSNKGQVLQWNLS